MTGDLFCDCADCAPVPVETVELREPCPGKCIKGTIVIPPTRRNRTVSIPCPYCKEKK